jgi:hypothetical protein
MAFNPFMPDNAPDSDSGAVNSPAPANASASAPAEPTSNAATANTLTPPTSAAPAQPPLNLQPAQPKVQPDQTPGNFFRRISHSFAGALIGTLAGSPAEDYSVDANGKTVATPRPDSTKSRIQRIAQAALEGLAHGAAVDSRQYPSGASKAAAGFGAGFVGWQLRLQQQDAHGRQQAQQDYERQQKKIMDRAVLGIHNAQQANYWMDAEQKQINMDTEGNNNDAIAQSVEDYISANPQAGRGPDGITVQRLNAAEGRAALAKQMSGDPHTAESHPLGNSTILVGKLVPVKDGEGNPIRNEDGSFKLTRQFVRISGSPDGKFVAPPVWLNDVKKYAAMMGGQNLDGFQPGQEIKLTQFAAINTKLIAAKKKIADAWDKPEQGFDKDGKPILINPLAASLGLPESTRPYQPGTTPNIENKIAAQAVETDLKKSQMYKNFSEGDKAKNDAKNASQKPIYAYNIQTKQTELTDRATMTASPGMYTNPRDVKQSDIEKDQQFNRQMADVQLNFSRYQTAKNALPSGSISPEHQGAATRILADEKMGGYVINELTFQNYMNQVNQGEKAASWNKLTPAEQEVLSGYLRAKASVVAYQKALSGVGKPNKEVMEIEMNNLPAPIVGKSASDTQFNAFQENLDTATQGYVKMPGSESPKEVRQRVEAEAASKAGATHVYEPTSGQAIPTNATPVKNIFGKIIGYKGGYDRVTIFPKQ